MENPVTFLNNTTAALTEMDELIPKELQMPVGIAIGVFVIGIILGLTKFSAAKKEEVKEVQFDPSTTEASFISPVKSKSAAVTNNGTPIQEKTGTVMTPAGRRSARLARRKED
mmetsp:Transcript_15692/g.32250  ORF Transcript_15692/g.32250 Transcript_15692/m.32250 type:complete len:113 (-) Transcript_15692:321-659(-)